MSIPHLFRCPISLDLFTDPVTLSTGQTYDRPSIERWLAAGNVTCPVTMQQLCDTAVVPNHTLRHLIDQWLLNGIDTSAPRPKTSQPIAVLYQNLQSLATVNLEILREVRALAVESDIGQACLIQLSFFPLLLELLFRPPRLEDPELVEVALDCVMSLSPASHLEALNMLRNDSSLASLVLLLDGQGNARISASLCYLLETIAASPATREVCLSIGRTREVGKALVLLLQSRADARASEAAARAMAALCAVEDNRATLVAEGAVDGLVSYLSAYSSRKAAALMALAALEALVGTETGRRAAVKSSGAVMVLVKLVFRVSDERHEGSEHAVGALLVVCRESARARAEAVGGGVVTQLLLLLQSQCGGKAKGKARALLKLLRAMWVKELQ